MRLIDADALDKILADAEIEARHNKRYVLQGAINTIRGNVAKMPTIEEQKKGKWIFKNDLKQFFCSECGVPSLTYDDVYLYSMNLPNFCEDCGADMRGEQDE